MMLAVVGLLLVWLALQSWYWVSLRTVKVVGRRLRQLDPEEAARWREWLRDDRPYASVWQPLVSATVVFPSRAIVLIGLCVVQFCILAVCAPFRRPCECAWLPKLTGLQRLWVHATVKRWITALTWAELRCLGVAHVEQYEVSFVEDGAAPDGAAAAHSSSSNSKVCVRFIDAPGDGRKEEPRNYVSNHVSYVDILLYIALLFPSFCSKSSVQAVPMIGDTAKWLNCIFINRSDSTERKLVLEAIKKRQRRVLEASTSLRNLQNQTLLKLLEFQHTYRSRDAADEAAETQLAAAKDLLTQEEATEEYDDGGAPDGVDSVSSLLVFPEGTTSNGRFLLPFKKGAFAAMKPVTPCLVVYDCPWYKMSYEIVPIVWLYPVLAGCTTGVTARVYWLREICPTVDMVLSRSVTAYTQMVREAMARVLLEVLPQERPLAEILSCTGDLSSKQACIKRLFRRSGGPAALNSAAPSPAEPSPAAPS